MLQNWFQRRSVEVDEHGTDAHDVLCLPPSEISFVDGNEDAGTSFIQPAELIGMLRKRAMQRACQVSALRFAVIKGLEGKRRRIWIQKIEEFFCFININLIRVSVHRLQLLALQGCRRYYGN